jgi:hypothetical protein
MSNHGNDATQQRDTLLLRLLKTPPQPRPKRERNKKKPIGSKRKSQAGKST